jgi:hypothetical protein
VKFKLLYFVLCFYALSCHHSSIDFNTDVKPILNEHCMTCHGGVKAEGGLSFLFENDVYKETKSGNKPIVRGNSAASELYKRITSEDPDVVMPAEGARLSEEEIEVLTAWIDQGAEWGVHWSYQQPDEEGIQEELTDWATNGIDHFVLNKLELLNLQPTTEADKETILRRVSLDLIGLPPSAKDTELFLADDSDSAYEQLVDRLLASQHFGERWAAVWLDLARYADSRGYQKDLLRPHIWRYRDWVIHAFNQDMPFDQFTIEQLAGDLLNNPTDDQLLATAFHRNTMTNDEGGTDDEEFRIAAVMDRLHTTFEIWQATTIACVQCHSHPYDPILHKEYYELFAFFNNTADKDLPSDKPTQNLLSPIDRKQLTSIKVKIDSMRLEGDTVSQQFKYHLANMEKLMPGPVQIMQELKNTFQRETHVFERGNWLVKGESVDPQTPSFLPAFNDSYEANRLGLAKWLVDDDNPLTSRVIVNRFWEQIFGKGIVETTEDFGTQGAKASHPELLDWLAAQFKNDYKWSVKTLIKTIVMSSTYRQSSEVNEELVQEDPYNRYLGRGPRFRLTAEQIRDQALVVSGLFSDKTYGQSVMPHQPDGVWNVIRHAATWKQDTTSDQYRRGLYTFWRRVSPYPSLQTFDAPTREFCVSRRINTNTPLQALVTLNDPVFVEAASALGKDVLNNGGNSLDSRIAYMYKKALLKEPSEKIQQTLKAFHEQVNEISNLTEESNELDEEDIWMNMASVVMNLDEFIMKN